ncbi:hypothetical protein VP01_3451g3 [Puccinia sorghi]|uniref:Uncharacterized protein n=1 Tax=Puccinia sorghi TaxID=27349 RepID=A0A0L6UW94_9BASI|nr:hypothetical protein VP01_3451g3 [Puccinia sorghi]
MHSHCADCTVTVPKNLNMQKGGVWMIAWLENAALCGILECLKIKILFLLSCACTHLLTRPISCAFGIVTQMEHHTRKRCYVTSFSEMDSSREKSLCNLYAWMGLLRQGGRRSLSPLFHLTDIPEYPKACIYVHIKWISHVILPGVGLPPNSYSLCYFVRTQSTIIIIKITISVECEANINQSIIQKLISSTAKKNLLNCLQLKCSMLQPSSHPNSAFLHVYFFWHSHCAVCTVNVHQSLVESILLLVMILQPPLGLARGFPNWGIFFSLCTFLHSPVRNLSSPHNIFLTLKNFNHPQIITVPSRSCSCFQPQPTHHCHCPPLVVLPLPDICPQPAPTLSNPSPTATPPLICPSAAGCFPTARPYSPSTALPSSTSPTTLSSFPPATHLLPERPQHVLWMCKWGLEAPRLPTALVFCPDLQPSGGNQLSLC